MSDTPYETGIDPGREVELNPQPLPPGGGETSEQPLPPGIEVEQPHGRTRLPESLRDRGADPPTAPGDQHHGCAGVRGHSYPNSGGRRSTNA